MAESRSRTLVKRNPDSALMPPPPARKRQKRPTIVLDEEEYSQAISDIIARDYFPGLREGQAQSEYMQALDSKNHEWIREAGRNLTQVMTPGPDSRRSARRGTDFAPRAFTMCETPRGYSGQTPLRTPTGDDNFAPEKPSADTDMSLTAFQSKYTSEDNESFNAILDKQNAQRAAKYGFLHQGNNIPSSRQRAYRERQQKLLDEQDHTSTALITRNADGDERKALAPGRPSQDLDDRPASLDSFPSRQGARNHLMFGPDGVENDRAPKADAEAHKSSAPPKAVNYLNTRFQNAASTDFASSVPSSPSMSAIDAAIAGRPRPTESEPGYTGVETPRVNGYAFVDAEPTQSELGMPVSDEEAEALEREAALRLLPKVDDSGPNPFKITESSDRENLHRRLVEKADAGRRKVGRLEQLRNLGITPGRTPTPKLATSPNFRKSANMTPAAKKLAERIGTPRHESGVFGSRSGWKLTPRVEKHA